MSKDAAVSVLMDVAGLWAHAIVENLPDPALALNLIAVEDDGIFYSRLDELDDVSDQDAVASVRAVRQAIKILRQP